MKVSKKIGLRLNEIINDYRYSTESILQQHVRGWRESENECLNELKLSELAECLLVAFEVEETTEDQILEIYNNINNLPGIDKYTDGYKTGYLDATKSVLNKYNIKIEGINA